MLASCIVGFHAVSTFHMSQDSLLGNGAAQSALGFPMLIHKQDNPPQVNLSSMSSLKISSKMSLGCGKLTFKARQPK